MLVLQIAGSGGTYPVELLPRFFQIINPFLPFTYAIEMMREAVGGIIWSTVWMDLLFLAGFWFTFILFGFFLKIIERENGTFHEQNTWIRYISLIFNEAACKCL